MLHNQLKIQTSPQGSSRYSQDESATSATKEEMMKWKRLAIGPRLQTSLHCLHLHPPQPWIKINPPLCICTEHMFPRSRGNSRLRNSAANRTAKSPHRRNSVTGDEAALQHPVGSVSLRSEQLPTILCWSQDWTSGRGSGCVSITPRTVQNLNMAIQHWEWKYIPL